jgi:hypothetical protein
VNSSGEVFVIEDTEVPTGPHAGIEVEDPFFQSESFKTSTHTVGTSSFGYVPLTIRDLYGNLGASPDRPMASQVPEMSVSYTIPLNHFTGMTSNAITVADQLLIGSHSNPTIQMAHSTMVPHVATIPTENVTSSQALIGTPLRPNPSVPLGYRALNPSITTLPRLHSEVLSLHLCLGELALVALIWLESPIILFLVSKYLTLGETSIWDSNSNGDTISTWGGNLRLESLTCHMDRM